MYIQEIRGKFLVINDSKYYNLRKVILIDNIEERVIKDVVQIGNEAKEIATSMSSSGKTLNKKRINIPIIDETIKFKDFKFTIFFEGDGTCELYFKSEGEALDFKNKIIQIVDSI